IPGQGGIHTGTKDFSDTLNPIDDPVDYYKIGIDPEWALSIWMDSSYPMVLEILDMNNISIDSIDPRESSELYNDESVMVFYYLRMSYPLFSDQNYQSKDRNYYIDMDIWSFKTIPETDPMDPWDTGIEIPEDSDTIMINLSEHFVEPNGDPIYFELLSDPQNLDVTMVNFSILGGTIQWVEAYITPYPNYHGVETLRFRCSDRDGSITDDLQITVISVNDLPYIRKIGIAVLEDNEFSIGVYEDEITVFRIEYGDDDDPSESLSFTTSGLPSFVDVNPANGTITIAAEQQHFGDYEFTITLIDIHGGRDHVNITLSVELVNEMPPMPRITITNLNDTVLMPGELIELAGSVGPDPDGDVLTLLWDFGDDSSAEGAVVNHSYEGRHWGNRTITLTATDGYLSNSTSVRVYVQKPEDVAVGMLQRTVNDEIGDSVIFTEDLRNVEDSEPIFTIKRTIAEGVEIQRLETIRRDNNLEVSLILSGSVELDGTVEYNIYIMPTDFEEADIDYNNISSWGGIPARAPEAASPLLHKGFYGSNNNASQGMLLSGKTDTLVFNFHFNELVKGGLSLPIDRDNFYVYAFVIQDVVEVSSGNSYQRYFGWDTAGDGALTVPPISKGGTSEGGGGSTIGDFAEKSWPWVITGVAVVALILVISGFFLVRKLKADNRRKEEEFLTEVERMREEGEDLFGKKEEEVTKKASYEDLYGAPAPKDHEAFTEKPASTLPSPGLGVNLDTGSHISEMELPPKQE
ncbi:MAG: PKD domain-containing protein, partial [Thermoplasmatota archaeon]